MSKRVVIAGFKHETNTFSKLATDLAAFHARGYYRGQEIVATYAGTNSEIAAFLDGCQNHGWHALPILAADATPSGRVTREAFETITDEILAGIDAAGRIDAVLLNLHGAMVTEHLDDGEGELLTRVRAMVGPAVPIAATLDLHANATAVMARKADILVSYCTYPHTDMYQTASACVELLARTLAADIKPTIYIARPPMLFGVDEGRTSAPGPMMEILAKAAAMRQRDPGILSVSINAGFGWADTREVGPTTIIVGDGNDPRFARAAEELKEFIWETRHRRTVVTTSAAQAMAIARAKGRVGSPVVVADYADNPGGGGYMDSPGLLRAMLDAGLEDAAMSALYDPASAARCHGAGIGATLKLALGGRVDPTFGPPIETSGQVVALSHGKFCLEGPMMRGLPVDLGPTAAVKIAGVEVVICSRRMQNYDRMFFKICGIDPQQRAVLAVKSMQHFRAAYAPLASEIVVVDEGGGVTSANFRALAFHNVPRPVWPLDMD